ncbi:MAG: 1,4-alpha-glucan branching enzyme, partial [Oscillospiraceae bacterium]
MGFGKELDLSLPVYLFHEGNNTKSYDFLGSHKTGNEDEVVFRVWAPNAQSISVVGDFNDWDPLADPMCQLDDGSIWECYIESGVKIFDDYKYSITSNKGKT